VHALRARLGAARPEPQALPELPEPVLVGRGRRAEERAEETKEEGNEDMSDRTIEIKITTGTSSRTIEWPEKSGPDYSEIDELRQYAAEHWWDAPEGSKEESLIGAIEMLAVQIKEQADCHARLVAAARDVVHAMNGDRWSDSLKAWVVELLNRELETEPKL
jgi:hypothetical protein